MERFVPRGRTSPTSTGWQPGVSHDPVASPPRSKLLDRPRQAIRARHYSFRTEEAYVGWIERFIFFYGVRDPAEMGEPEINAFLTHLAVKEHVRASTQNQARSALLFLYRHVLGREVGELGEVIRAGKPKRLPVVMTRGEVKAVLAQLTGDKWLMASPMCGAGLRLMECVRLRVQDIDFARNEIAVHDGKGTKDRITMHPKSLKKPLQEHLCKVKAIHGRIWLKDGGACKCPTRWTANIPTAPWTGTGNGFSLRRIGGRTKDRRGRASSHGRITGSKSGERCCHKGRIAQASHVPYVPPFVRNAPFGK